MTSSKRDRKIAEIIRECKYDIEIDKYMSLKPALNMEGILDEDTRLKTLHSILNKTALFLGVDCDNCGIELVDPTGGVLTKKNQCYARCGRCGYSGLINRHVYRIV